MNEINGYIIPNWTDWTITQYILNSLSGTYGGGGFAFLVDENVQKVSEHTDSAGVNVTYHAVKLSFNGPLRCGINLKMYQQHFEIDYEKVNFR